MTWFESSLEDRERKELRGFRVSAGMARAGLRKLAEVADLASDFSQRVVRVAFGSWANGPKKSRQTQLRQA